MVTEIPVTEARERLASILDEARRVGPVFLTRRRRREVVLLRAEEYERMLEALEDAEDVADADAAVERIKAGEPTLPWAQVERDLGW